MSKSGTNLTCFAHFYLKMCFSPERRVIFQHLNFKKWFEHISFLALSLQNALLVTAACNFSTSYLQKKVRSWYVFCTFWFQTVLLATTACNFWFFLWPHDSAPIALTSLLFDPPDIRIIGKTLHFATSLTSSFFLLYFIFWLYFSILSEVYNLNFLLLHNFMYSCMIFTDTYL